MPDFTTGPATLPDVGELSYNGCTFSPLFETNVAGSVVKDAANRTTKFMEYTITADGYVTLSDTDATIDDTMQSLRFRLTQQAGVLVYSGRGNQIVVNRPGGVADVAWGPIPELLDFQPLGAGRSAKIKWQVKTRIPQVAPVGGRLGPVLQFNEETGVTYDEAGYSTLSIRGTLEIPLTRIPQTNRVLASTVDNFRETFMQQIARSIDLTRFRVTRREFNISRDKRTLEWDFAAEELPYMGLPPWVTIARGTFNFRPAKAGMGLVTWLCTLRVTYTVRKDKPRRVAWDAFLALLRVRMAESVNATFLNGQNPGPNNAGGGGLFNIPAIVFNAATTPWWIAALPQNNQAVANGRKAWIIDLSGDEGMYLDSKATTFSATWRLVCPFDQILLASGLWKKFGGDGGNAWAMSVQDISGWQSWLSNRLNAAQDVIVDFGGDQ